MLKRLALLLALSLSALAAHAQDAGDDLLDPNEAFALQAEALGADRIQVEWTIADSYYMYRDKIRLRSETEGITLGEPQIPRGKVKQDEFFGQVETLRHRVRIEVPIQRAAGAPSTLKLTAHSQGCADVGVCYPPLTQHAVLNLPAATPQAADALQSLAALTGDTVGAEPELLDPDQAFAFTLETGPGETLIARWRIAEGYYLYRDKLSFALKDAAGLRLGEPELPRGKVKHDEFFGEVEILRHEIEARLPLIRQDPQVREATLVVGYQGCADAGVCYPPISREVSFELGASTGQPAAAAPAGDGFVSEQDAIAQSLASGATWLTVVTFFGFGLLLAFTPCVFPMIPILSGIIIGQGEKISTGRAFGLSLAYVLAMALTYTVAGVLAGLFGANLQVWFQNPWVLSIFAAIFVLLSLSMFGFYELQMPAGIQSKLAEVSNRQQGGHLLGAAIMGFLSALIVGPCVTAPLIGALIYIGQTGDAVLGGLALFALSLGMGAPLLAIGTSAGKLLPRAGAWMDAVKAVFGVLLLAVALWMLERILPTAVTMALWAALLIASGVYLGALEPLREGASGWFRLWKSLGVALLVWGVLMLVGAAAGGRDLLQPLRGVLVSGAGETGAHTGLVFQQVKGPEGLDQALAAARREGRPVMLDFYADWCISCKEMEKYTFGDAQVQAALEGVVLLQTDVTANDAQDQALLKRFGLFGPPAILFFNPQGEELANYRVVGFVPADEFAAHVRRALQR